MIARYTSAAGVGALATLSLLLLMNALVLVQPGAFSKPRPKAEVKIVRVRKSEELRTRDLYRPDESIKKVESLPPRLKSEPRDGLAIATTVPPPPAPSGSHSLTAIGMSDGPLVVIVRVQPVYPASAEVRGLEGWVLVQFDVLADGRVADAFVVESSNRVFDKAAISAASRFRFKPQVVNGEPVVTRGVRNLFRFEMPDT